MYLFKKNGEMIEKYFIGFNAKDVEKLRYEIINNCSKIVHQECDSTDGPNRFDHLRIRNYHRSERIETYEYTDGPDEEIYHFSYDEYKFPYLVSLIDKLLDGDISALEKIYHPNFKHKEKDFKKMIEIASKEADKIDNLNVEEKIEKLKEIQCLFKNSELNKNRKPINDYYLRLQGLIKSELIGSVSISEILKVKEFLDSSLVIDNNIKKLLKPQSIVKK